MRIRHLEKSEQGQAAVEFALCLPLLLLILCAVIDFGWVFAHELSLSTAAREGARVAIINADDSACVSKATVKAKESASICNNGTLNVRVTQKSGGDVEVQVSYDLQMLSPMAKLIFKNKLSNDYKYQIRQSCIMHAG